MPYAILRTAKLSTLGQIAASAQHTFRERETPNADLARTPDNIVRGATSSRALVDAVKARVALAEQIGKDPVLCIEYMVTLSPEAWHANGGHVGEKSGYFRDAAAWIIKRHGADNVVSLAVHRDETTPHLVAYVVPLVEREARTRRRSVIVGKEADGQLVRETREFPEEAKRVLSAKHFLGGREKLRAMQTDFAEKVGRKHGLERGLEGSRARHQTVKQFYARINKAPEIGALKIPKREIIKGVLLDSVETDESYSKRILLALNEQIEPLAGKAKLTDAASARAREMARTAQEAHRREEIQRERVKQLEAERQALIETIRRGGPELERLQAELSKPKVKRDLSR
jgi:hypothetical protein